MIPDAWHQTEHKGPCRPPGATHCTTRTPTTSLGLAASHELVNGIAYVREPPAPLRSHQELVGELYHQVRQALGGKRCRAYIAPFDSIP